MAAGDSDRVYTFSTIAGSKYLVYATVSQDRLELDLQDSLRRSTIAVGSVVASAAPLTASAALQFNSAAGGTRTLVAKRIRPGTSVTFQLLVYRVNAAPENRPAAFTIGDIVTGETIELAADVDVFTARVAAAQDIVLAADAPSVTGAGPLLLTVLDSVGTTTLGTTYFPTGVPASVTTGRIRLPAAGAYQFRFESAWPTDIGVVPFHGAYEFRTYAISRAPEQHAAAVPLDSAIVGESIDPSGDVDEFTFTAPAGSEVNAFFQSAVTSHLEIAPVSGALMDSVTAGADTGLFAHSTGRITLATGGTYVARVSGDGTTLADTGAYRIFLYRVNRKPESVPDTLALGDSVLGEAIELPGDVDEYRVHVPATSGATLMVALPGAGTLLAEIVDSAADTTVATARSSGNGIAGGTGALRLGPGTYIVRVEEEGDSPHLRGPYELWLFTFGFGPETVHDTIAIGDTVQGESIDVPGDVDTYHFYGARRQHINVMIQGTGATTASDAPQAFINGPWGPPAPFALVASGSAAAALTDHQTTRMDLPATGWYTLTITSGGTSPGLTDRGPYRFAVVPVETAPESRSGALAIGDSVATEAIDVPGDWDQFTVTATPGQELYALFGTQAPCCIYPSVMAFDPATGDTLANNVGQGTRIVGPFLVPAGGAVSIAAFEAPQVFFRQCYDATCEGLYRYTGPYGLRVLALNRAPETAPAAYTLGDTVSTEAIYPEGDIDEFTLTATPGDTLSAWFRLRADAMPVWAYMTLVMVDAATGAVLTPAAGISGAMSSFTPEGQIVVPSSGRILVRVLGWGSFGTNIGTAPYEFFVRRGP